MTIEVISTERKQLGLYESLCLLRQEGKLSSQRFRSMRGMMYNYIGAERHIVKYVARYYQVHVVWDNGENISVYPHKEPGLFTGIRSDKIIWD